MSALHHIAPAQQAKKSLSFCGRGLGEGAAPPHLVRHGEGHTGTCENLGESNHEEAKNASA